MVFKPDIADEFPRWIGLENLPLSTLAIELEQVNACSGASEHLCQAHLRNFIVEGPIFPDLDARLIGRSIVNQPPNAVSEAHSLGMNQDFHSGSIGMQQGLNARVGFVCVD